MSAIKRWRVSHFVKSATMSGWKTVEVNGFDRRDALNKAKAKLFAMGYCIVYGSGVVQL